MAEAYFHTHGDTRLMGMATARAAHAPSLLSHTHHRSTRARMTSSDLESAALAIQNIQSHPEEIKRSIKPKSGLDNHTVRTVGAAATACLPVEHSSWASSHRSIPMHRPALRALKPCFGNSSSPSSRPPSSHSFAAPRTDGDRGRSWEIVGGREALRAVLKRAASHALPRTRCLARAPSHEPSEVLA